ncbi:hypothetical protein GcC1_067029 [Golovinomyces cichoracearum]|uniref:Uncharacterized protein n=1 Tax=Golovinomyces cichoracearum TaxID=62708 RepID=A0A420IR46_9PEZI|nr:hypothetical protein GcC1_067029 [Golovinomyces cichoracearum]
MKNGARSITRSTSIKPFNIEPPPPNDEDISNFNQGHDSVGREPSDIFSEGENIHQKEIHHSRPQRYRQLPARYRYNNIAQFLFRITDKVQPDFKTSRQKELD